MSKKQLKVKSDIKVFDDKKTNAKTIALPFRLPDGTSAVLMVTRLKSDAWVPEITSVTINYEDKKNTTSKGGDTD